MINAEFICAVTNVDQCNYPASHPSMSQARHAAVHAEKKLDASD